MNQSPDEAKAARIQKYKEERRKQLTARTATLFSANVTERRPRKAVPRTSIENGAAHLKSSSELNLTTATTSVPIRTTRTSRLRAAASHSDSNSSPKKANRSSSVQSLLEDDKTKPIKDKTRPLSHRRQSREKENLKTISPTSCKEIGAIRTKHSIKNSIDKDKSNLLLSSSKKKNVDVKNNSKLDTTKKKTLEAENVVRVENDDSNADEVFNIILGDKNVSNSLDKDQFEELYRDLVEESNVHADVNEIICHKKSELNYFNNENNIPFVDEEYIKHKQLHVRDGDVPKVNEVGLLGAVCIRKVEKFSELFTSLCAPCEADVLFEDLLAEDGSSDSRVKAPECTPPCRRAQLPRVTSTPKRAQDSPLVANGDGIATNTKSRRSTEVPISKTESSKSSVRKNLIAGVQTLTNKLPCATTPLKSPERRRSSESGNKPSFIPLSKTNRKSPSKNSNEPVAKIENVQTKSRNDRLKIKSLRKSPEKAKSDSETNRNDKTHRAQRSYESSSENNHNSKKRLTRLGKSTDGKNMSTLHETVRPHTGSRLSQEMDNLAALTKQTLDRVNKLSNNLKSNKLNEPNSDNLASKVETQRDNNNHAYNFGLLQEKPIANRGVTERLQDIDAAAERLIDFEKQSAMFSDLSNDSSSQHRRLDNLSSSHHTPVSILKRKSIHEDTTTTSTPNNSIASPPVTFSPSVVEPRSCRSESRQRQGILKKRRSLDESQVARRRSCSPEVSFADDGSSDTCKPILKNRRSSLEDVVRNRSPDGQIHGILKRKMSREDEHVNDDVSHGSPEPHGILKRKSNSSSSSSTTSSHVSIAQAVLLAAAGGAELVEREEDKDAVRPILKKKSFSEERPSIDVLPLDTPKPILKKKSIEHDDHDFELPKKPILKSYKKLSGDEGHTSSFDLSEDDRSSRRPSLLRSRTSDQSGSECEAAVRPILKQRGSSLTRERSQSPRPRLSFCADNDANTSATNFSSESNDLLAAGPRRVLNLSSSPDESYPSAVIRRRNLRPKANPRSMSLVSDVNEELLSILNNRRRQVDTSVENDPSGLWDSNETPNRNNPKQFPSIASRIKDMEQALSKDNFLRDRSTSKVKNRDNDRYKTQPVTIDEMRSITSSLEPGQQSFQAFGSAACSFPASSVESGAASLERGPNVGEAERDPYKAIKSPPYNNSFNSKFPPINDSETPSPRNDSFGEALFLDFEKIAEGVQGKQSTLDEIEQEVNKVRVALDEDSRALEEDERNQGEADNWSLNVSCDSGVYNRASSRDSGPHSGEELGLIESQEISDNHAANSSQDWSSSSIENGLINMNRERKSTENEALRSPDEARSDDENENQSGFALGLVKSNSVVARASMWQQLQQKAKGTPKPLLRHSRSKLKDDVPVMERFKAQSIDLQSPPLSDSPQDNSSLAQAKTTANVLDRDEDDVDDDSPSARAQRMITPEVRGILKSGCTVVPVKPNTLAKGESSEGLKDEGIDSSSDDESSASTVSSSEKSCSSSDSSEDIPGPKFKRFQRKSNKLRSSRTESDLTNYQDQRKIQLPGANEFKERLTQAKNANVKIPLLGKLGRKPSEVKPEENIKASVKKPSEPLQLGKLRRPMEKTASIDEKPPVLKITALNQDAKNKFFGLEAETKERNVDELAAKVRKYIAPVSKSVSTHAMEGASGSDGESSGGREVRQINTRSRHRNWFWFKVKVQYQHAISNAEVHIRAIDF
ncbi:unnamed protein product [Leptosia nina]|uniref:Uncharacterized protein n=1 Tax=Leptosia nina TaxID=320188 RepID=A0AAV1J6E3_9NEOP